jgi:hypothetical protein
MTNPEATAKIDSAWWVAITTGEDVQYAGPYTEQGAKRAAAQRRNSPHRPQQAQAVELPLQADHIQAGSFAEVAAQAADQLRRVRG